MLRFEITGLWHPDGSGGWDPLVTYAQLHDFTDAQVVIPINGQRTAQVTISLNDPAAAFAHAYKYMLRAYYADETDPVFWGAITLAEPDSANGTVKISAGDRAVSLTAHFIRKGDQALNSATDPTLPNEWDRHVPANGAGLAMLLDAAQNLAGHQADTYPPLGVSYVYDDTSALPDDTPLKAQVTRGDRVWDSAVQLTPQDGSTEVGLPDLELAPVKSEAGIYAHLNVYQRQGGYDALRDRTFTHPLQIHAGWGKDNADIAGSEGGQLATHVHVLSDKGTLRITRADTTSAAEHGIYVIWVQTQYKASKPDLLELVGDNTLATWSQPVTELTITPKTEWEYRFLRDYIVGGQAKAVMRVGYYQLEVDVRITQVTLAQADQANNTSEQLNVLPDISGLTGDGTDGF